jgi:2-polyprenyl-3-methyl-5-hydroxy-6-metoxy-1,4-benzoquinol methylase
MDEGLSREHHRSKQAWMRNALYWDERMGEGNVYVRELIWPATYNLLQPSDGEYILDIACGNGLGARQLADAGARVLAFDFCQPLLERAIARSAGSQLEIEYRVIDATDLAAMVELGSTRFDAAVCSMALFDISDVRPIFTALRQLLKPGGRFVFTVLHPCFNGPRAARLIEEVVEGGQLRRRHAVRVEAYLQAACFPSLAITGQPEPHPFFHRSLQDLFGPAFQAGMMLDGLEERAFSADLAGLDDPLSWRQLHDIPVVMAARFRNPA